MKRDYIIIIAFFVYVITMSFMLFGVDSYVKSKDKRLCDEIHEKVQQIFRGKECLIDIAFSGNNVGYEKIAIPSKPKDLQSWQEDLRKSYLKKWNEKYGDLIKMYRTDFIEDEYGWSLVMITLDWDGVYQNYIFPYAVGYKKQKYSWEYEYLPSVRSAVNNALDFFISNEKSSYYELFEKGCYNRIWNEIYDASNEYYYMSKDKTPKIHFFENLFEQDTNDGIKPSQAGFMQNGLYKVFIASTQPMTWTIRKKPDNPDEKDRNALWLYWTIGLTILLLLVVVPLMIIERKHQKIINETLYEKLKRMCNPSNFIRGDDYNKEIVEKANIIYKTLMEINENDTEILNELRQQAESNLGISLIDAEKLADLKEKVNPKNYMIPYNHDKVTLANELYAKLNSDRVTYNDLIEIEEKANELLL